MNRVRLEAASRKEAISDEVAASSSSSPINPAGQRTESVSEKEETVHTHVVLPSQPERRVDRRWQYTLLSIATAAALLLVIYSAGQVNRSNDKGANPIVKKNNGGELPKSPIDGNPGQSPPELRNPAQLVVQPEGPLNVPSPNTPSSPSLNSSAPNRAAIPSTNGLVDIPGNAPGVDPTQSLVDPSSPFVEGGFTAEDMRILRLLESLVIVSIECTPVTAQQREFDQILKKFKITLAEKSTPEQAADALPAETEVYYIESSASQAEAVLNEVNARNTEFTSMAMRTETTQTKNALNLNATGAEEQPQKTPEVEVLEGRGSFAEKFHLETKEELAALQKPNGATLTSSDVYPFLQRDAALDAILGASDVEAEHLVRMLVVLRTVVPQEEN